MQGGRAMRCIYMFNTVRVRDGGGRRCVPCSVLSFQIANSEAHALNATALEERRLHGHPLQHTRLPAVTLQRAHKARVVDLSIVAGD